MPPAPCTTGSTITAASSWACWAASASTLAAQCSSQRLGEAVGRALGEDVLASIPANRLCMPLTGSQTAIAPTVSPW